jgi:hypothetical protein
MITSFKRLALKFSSYVILPSGLLLLSHLGGNCLVETSKKWYVSNSEHLKPWCQEHILSIYWSLLCHLL